MLIPQHIYLKKGLDVYLQTRGLVKQYYKAKELFLSGFVAQIDLGIRQPKTDRVFYFRINKQYRAFGYYEEEDFYVFHIDDHKR